MKCVTNVNPDQPMRKGAFSGHFSLTKNNLKIHLPLKASEVIYIYQRNGKSEEQAKADWIRCAYKYLFKFNVVFNIYSYI